MKIIDKKGKLFGVINIIDLLVLILLLFAIVGGAKRLMSKPQLSEGVKKAVVTYEVSEIRTVSVENIVVGEKIYHYDKGAYIGEIVDKKVEPYKEKIEKPDGTWGFEEVPEKYNVIIKIEGDIKESPEFYSFGGEQTRVGIQYRMKTKRAAFFGTCLGIDIKE
ncbi:MAG: DUF4330 domain-containing protein [Tissierellia bacterium]|nr:DUF4330 domain-containing protein [Tissierellia bacterium]